MSLFMAMCREKEMGRERGREGEGARVRVSLRERSGEIAIVPECNSRASSSDT